MSKILHETEGGYYITEEQISNLEGKLLTQIEAMGLQGSQESAAKSLIRQEVWDLVPNDNYVWIEKESLKKLELNVVWNGPGAPFLVRKINN